MNIFTRLRLRLATLFSKKHGLFYINGPDVLPSPLSLPPPPNPDLFHANCFQPDLIYPERANNVHF